MHHRTLLVTILTIASITAGIAAQFPAGWRDTAIQNTTTSGSASLGVRIYYPATSAGANAPLRTQSGGYPVVVHLHGLGGRATTYTELGTTLAEAGFVAVLNDTAQFNPDLQVLDGIALFPSLVAENQRTTSVFQGALDMTRAGVSGHSMGGGSTVRTLAARPGYIAGFCFAPWDGTIGGQGNSWTNSAPLVDKPLAILHGEGDTVVNWQSIGLRFYTRATGYTGLKSFVLLDTTATHNNVVRLPGAPSSGDREVFARAMAMVTGWFDKHLRGGVTGLEQVVGNATRNDTNFKSISSEYRTPELWRFGPTGIGTTSTLTIGGEPGNGVIYISPGTKTTTLPFGILKLDPVVILPVVRGTLDQARIVSINTVVPNDPNLKGAKAWFQGATDGGAPGLQLTDVVPFFVL